MKDKTLKQLVKIQNAIAEAINEEMGADLPEDFERGAPCLRIEPSGEVVQINCKTGEIIKKA